jgi:hypothetical protein
MVSGSSPNVSPLAVKGGSPYGRRVDEDKPPSTAQRLRVVGLQLVGASAIVWTLTALVALQFRR